mmetsp:Transcript_4377/g.15713  ORF Transcript_4377/g.15713 Transcript_4377/m.15713 type:complete len:657 (+) Transcript_4377:2513-4483(+)
MGTGHKRHAAAHQTTLGATPPKVRRPSGSALERRKGSHNAEQRRVQNLLTWFEEVGIWWDQESLRITGGGIDGIGVFARKPLEAQQVIGRIPKSAVLSVRNGHLSGVLLPLTQASASDGAQEEHEHSRDRDGNAGPRLRPDSALALTILFERALGRESEWCGYIAALTESEPVPLFWTDAEAMFLQGTELDNAPYEDMGMLFDEYEQTVRPILEHHGFFEAELRAAITGKAGAVLQQHKTMERNFGFEEYLKALSLVSSRAFFVDKVHGASMLPLSDLFNHKVALIEFNEDEAQIEGNERALQADDLVLEERDCAPQGLPAPIIANLEGWTESSNRSSRRHVESALLQHAKLVHGASYHRGRPDLAWELMICTQPGVEDVLEVICLCKKARGCQVFNTYGELSNGTLLHDYAFVPRFPLLNPFSLVNISVALFHEAYVMYVEPNGYEGYSPDKATKPTAADVAHRSRVLRRRVAFARAHPSVFGSVSSPTDYIQFDHTRTAPQECVVLLYLLLMPEAEFDALAMQNPLFEELEYPQRGRCLPSRLEDIIHVPGVVEVMLAALALRAEAYKPCQSLSRDMGDMARLESLLANDVSPGTLQRGAARKRPSWSRQMMATRLKVSEKAILRTQCEAVIEGFSRRRTHRARLRMLIPETLL